MIDIPARLSEARDAGCRDFQCRLMPTVDPASVLGVRMPVLRALAKEMRGTPEASAFLAALPHRTYEEDNLHALLLNDQQDFAQTVRALDAFLPFVNNWATCDTLAPRSFRARPPELAGRARAWIASARTYTVRFGLGVLMRNYLDEGFDPAQLALAASLRTEEYYINMMIAWYFATALAKRYDETLPFIRARALAPWTHAKAIQKAIESFRVPDARKAALRALK